MEIVMVAPISVQSQQGAGAGNGNGGNNNGGNANNNDNGGNNRMRRISILLTILMTVLSGFIANLFASHGLQFCIILGCGTFLVGMVIIRLLNRVLRKRMSGDQATPNNNGDADDKANGDNKMKWFISLKQIVSGVYIWMKWHIIRAYNRAYYQYVERRSRMTLNRTNWWGLKADSCLILGVDFRGFRTIFMWWVVRLNILAVLALLALALFMGIWGGNLLVIGTSVFVIGLVSLAVSEIIFWVYTLPAMAGQKILFHKRETGYTSLREREGEILDTYDDRFRIKGEIYWNGCWYQGDKPYVCREKLSADKDDPTLITIKPQIIELDDFAETRDAETHWELWIRFQIPTANVRDVVLGSTAIWGETNRLVIRDRMQDMLTFMATYDARFLQARREILTIDLDDPPIRPFDNIILDGKEVGMPPTDWAGVVQAAQAIDNSLEEIGFIEVLNWGITKIRTKDGKLEDAFARRSIAAQDLPAAQLEKLAIKAREEGRLEPFKENMGADARAFAALHGADAKFTDIRVDPKVNAGVGAIAGALSGNSSGGKSGNDKKGGGSSNKGKGGQRQPRPGRRNRKS